MKNFALKRRVLIVGEGRETEYNYFVGFRNTHERELEATATSVAVRRGKGHEHENRRGPQLGFTALLSALLPDFGADG